MRRACLPFLMLLIGFLLPGCGGKETAVADKPTTEPASKMGGADPMTIPGAGGVLAVGDSLDDAKRAFPMPKGATPVPDPGIKFRNQTHWGWESKNAVFDAYAEGEKLDWFSYSMKLPDAKARDAIVAADIEAFGQPKERVKGKASEVLVWELDDAVRVVMNLAGEGSPSVVRVMGFKQVLQEQGLPTNDIKSFVQTLDEGAGK